MPIAQAAKLEVPLTSLLPCHAVGNPIVGNSTYSSTIRLYCECTTYLQLSRLLFYESSWIFTITEAEKFGWHANTSVHLLKATRDQNYRANCVQIIPLLSHRLSLLPSKNNSYAIPTHLGRELCLQRGELHQQNKEICQTRKNITKELCLQSKENHQIHRDFNQLHKDTIGQHICSELRRGWSEIQTEILF